MSDHNTIERFSPGGFISSKLADHANQIVDAINSQQPRNGFIDGRGGIRPWFFAKITTTGPASEADYSDYRYWAKPQKVLGTSDVSTLSLADDDDPRWSDSGAHPGIITVYSITDIVTAARTLAADDIVIISAFTDQGDGTKAASDNPNYHYYIVGKASASSVGEFQHQIVGYMVSTNQTGASFARAHGLP